MSLRRLPSSRLRPLKDPPSERVELLDSQTQVTGLISHYNISGQVLRVQTQGEGEAKWVAAFFNGFYLIHTTPPAGRQPAITLSIRSATPPSIPSGLQSFAINHGDCYTDGRQYFLTVDDSLIHICDPEQRLIEVSFGETAHARHPVALVNTFSYALQAALRRAGVFDVHAAGAVEPVSERGALFVGASGSGKTTLTLRLTEAGWRYLSDDMVVLRETASAVEAEGLRRLFAVAHTSVVGSSRTRVSAALGQSVASDPSKRKLEPETVFPDSRAESCRLRALFFPQLVDAEKTRVEKISPGAAMRHLMKHCPWATYDTYTAPDYLRVLARLANQCRAYELLAGRDLLLDPQLASDLLTPCLSE